MRPFCAHFQGAARSISRPPRPGRASPWRSWRGCRATRSARCCAGMPGRTASTSVRRRKPTNPQRSPSCPSAPHSDTAGAGSGTAASTSNGPLSVSGPPPSWSGWRRERPSCTSAELEWMPSATTVAHVASCTHWPGPVLMRILRAAARFQQRGAMLVIGPGARPSAAAALMETPGENRILFDRAVRSADVIQASVDDIAWLYPGKAPEAVAESWLHTGPDLVVINRGPGSAVALREPGIAVHRPSRRANANGEDGSGANAAEAFTAGLLGALYRLRQRKLALRELNAEGLTAILDTALHAPAGTSINSLLPVVPEYFRFINTAKLTLPLLLSRGPRGPANQVRRTCRAGAGAARRKGETDASPRSSCTCVQVVRHRHGHHRCFLVSRHSCRPGWRQHRQRGSGPCEVCGHHPSQGPSHAHNAVRRPLQAARAAALDNQVPVCRGGRALHARRPEPDRATGAQRPAHRGGAGERQHPVPRRHEHDV